MYYSLQYQRIGQLENMRLQLSNYIVAASVIALGLIVIPEQDLSWVALLVPASVTILNLLAIAYSAKSRLWIKLHQARAKQALADLSPRVAQLQARAEAAIVRPDSSRDLLRRQRIEAYVHGVIALVALVILIEWLASQ